MPLRFSLRLAVVVILLVLVVIVFSISSARIVDVLVVTTARANDALLGKWNLCVRMGKQLCSVFGMFVR